MINQVAAIALLAFAASTAALECDPARYPWAGVSPAPTFDIVQPTPLQSYTKFLQGTLKLTGKIKIINGCTFQMIDIGVEQAVEAAQLQWLGAKLVTDTEAAKISESTFFVPGASGSGQFAEGPYFTLTKVAGRAMSFYDFSIMRLFSQLEQNSYAIVTLTGGNMTLPAIGEPPRFSAPAIPAGLTEAPITGATQTQAPPAASSPAAAGPAPSQTAPSASAPSASAPSGTSPTTPASTTRSSGVATKVSLLGVVAICMVALF